MPQQTINTGASITVATTPDQRVSVYVGSGGPVHLTYADDHTHNPDGTVIEAPARVLCPSDPQHIDPSTMQPSENWGNSVVAGKLAFVSAREVPRQLRITAEQTATVEVVTARQGV